ncbi:MAG: hypothetical protein P1U52_07620 [Porticoccaceae bacterium]|jgi:hypothetical protein|nr:hypothetical protein [Porticoccaceae bacterium]
MKLGLTLASLVSLAIALVGGWNELHGVLTIGFLAFVSLLFTAHLDQIAEFTASGTGITAKTREVLSKAENTVTELQSLAKIFAGTTLSSVKRSGRFGGYEDDEEEQIKESVLEVLKDIGLKETEFNSVLVDWHRFTKFDYVMAILGGNTIPQGFEDQSIQTEWKQLRDFKKIPTSNDIKEFLSKWQLLDKARSEYLSDYEYYIVNLKHRRPEVWKERESWEPLKKP